MLGIYNQNSFYNTNVYQNYGFNFNSLFSSILGRGHCQQPRFGSAFPGINIFNYGNIGSINIGGQSQQNPFAGLFQNLLAPRIQRPCHRKRPVVVDEETIEVKPKEPKKVYLFGNDKYAKGNFWEIFRKNNGALVSEFEKVNLSEEAKNAINNYKNYGKQTLIISEDGELIGIKDSNELSKLLGGAALGKKMNGGKDGSSTAKGKEFEYSGTKFVVKDNSFVSPLTFDLNGDGVKTSNKLTRYDINGDGKLDTINDVADGTLCIRGGKSGLDLFGNNTDIDGDGKADGYKNGFDALKALAKKEGLINDKGDMKLDTKDLKVLEKKYGLQIKTDGYNSDAKSLESAGITEIDLGKTDKTESVNNFDGQGNLLMKQAGATFKINGQEREYADVWHTIK